MSSFSALKTAIANAIKQNGNQEITGNLLQGILLSIVETLGDTAINNLETGLSNESTTRGNADTNLNNLITGVKNNVDNGYVYAGIAIPSTTPVSGKVFYIATKAGTYTNLGGLSVTEGITILKYNGSTWSKEQVIYGNGGVYDVTAQNGGTTFASLSALLSDANLSTLIPLSARAAGMSIRFVLTSTNRFVQYRYLDRYATGTPNNPFLDIRNWEKEGVVDAIFIDGSMLHSKYPARADGSLSESGNFSGYKVDLTGLYEKGIRYIIFKGTSGNSLGSTNSIIPGYIALSNDTIEKSIVPSIPLIADWYMLPITGNSSYLYASYQNGGTYGQIWQPELVYLEVFNIKPYDDRISALEEKVNTFVSYSVELQANPARVDGSSSESGYFSGYKVDLTGLYDKGIRTVIFRGSTPSSMGLSNAVVPGYIALADNSVESVEKGATPKTNDWFCLQITKDSKYLLASYCKNELGGEVWQPECVYFEAINIKSFNNRIASLEESIGICESLAGSDGSRNAVASLTDGESLKLSNFTQSNRKNDLISFGCKVTSFDSIKFEFGTTKVGSQWLILDETSISLYDNELNPKETYNHGLTIETMLNVNANVQDTGKLLVTIQTLNGYYSVEFDTFGYTANGERGVTSIGSTLTDCQISATNKDFKCPIWIFGASYENINDRWISYVREMGYFNYLVNGYGGRTSYWAYTELLTALNFGTPKYLLWTIFGNDGSDAQFAEYIGKVVDLCEEKGIEPIFLLRPDTPTIDFSARRNAVIATGKRYVDEQKVLQKTLYADGGQWYDGYLSGDGIHPTSLGWKAIAMQMTIDFPEIMEY